MGATAGSRSRSRPFEGWDREPCGQTSSQSISRIDRLKQKHLLDGSTVTALTYEGRRQKKSSCLLSNGVDHEIFSSCYRRPRVLFVRGLGPDRDGLLAAKPRRDRASRRRHDVDQQSGDRLRPKRKQLRPVSGARGLEPAASPSRVCLLRQPELRRGSSLRAGPRARSFRFTFAEAASAARRRPIQSGIVIGMDSKMNWFLRPARST